MSATIAAPGPAHRELSRRRALEDALLVFLPALLTFWLLYRDAAGGLTAVDFRQAFYIAGERVLHGGDPYAWSHAQILAGVSFPYPAATAVLYVPLALLPAGVACVVATAACVLAVPAALRVLGIGDRRVLGAALLWPAVVVGWQTANLTLPLMLGLALLWRERDRPWHAGVLVAILVSLKPIMLPLGLWLLATRRYRAALAALASGAIINAAAWSLVGWGAFSSWLALVSHQGALLYSRGYGAVAVLCHLGLLRGPATVTALGLAALLAWAVVRFGRSASERQAF